MSHLHGIFSVYPFDGRFFSQNLRFSDDREESIQPPPVPRLSKAGERTERGSVRSPSFTRRTWEGSSLCHRSRYDFNHDSRVAPEVKDLELILLTRSPTASSRNEHGSVRSPSLTRKGTGEGQSPSSNSFPIRYLMS
jgi:hypothetical protein